MTLRPLHKPILKDAGQLRKIIDGTTVPARTDTVSRQISSQFSAIRRVLMKFRASP
jgi:hypothetical protein